MVGPHHQFIARRVDKSVELVRDFEGMYKAADDPHGQAQSASNLAHSVYYHVVPQLRDLLQEAAPDGRLRYLDVGSGLGFATARFASVLRADGWTVDARGVDVSPEACRRANERLAPAARFDIGSLLDPELRQKLGTFQLVTCLETLCYFRDEEVSDVVGRLGSLVAAGGLLAVSYHLPQEMSYGRYVRSLDDLRRLFPGFEGRWEMDFIDSKSRIYDGATFGRHLFSVLERVSDGA